ncbi:MAG: hypothetical protein L0331_04755 [Chloroflexi bacterium]|nr:hypothetical protein [Chloroflexota bacterium]
MNEALTNGMGDTLSALLVTTGLRCAALVDDVYDPLELMELPSGERDELWTRLEADDEALADLERIGHQLSNPGELTSMVLAAFDASRAQCPAFERVWLASMVGNRVEAGRGQVKRLKGLLEQDLGLKVGTFGRNSPTEDLVSDEAQLLFIDWYLGDDVVPDGEAGVVSKRDMPAAVKVAVAKVMDILSRWPDRPKPIFVLMSSRPGLREHAGEFCRHSGILRGMFYAVPKRELTDRFKLRMHMRLFAMSLTAGRDLQTFVDALDKKFDDVKKEFLKGISDLTLNDYAYVQSLSLQDDGQPLGDYLLWLFSAYLGQLLFANALRDERAKLDSMTFTKALPSLDPPSDRLTEIYHTALFDTSVGPITPHARAARVVTTAEASANPSALTLGDVLRYQMLQGDGNVATTDTVTEQGKIESQGAASRKPDLLLVINPQCDLEFTPDRNTRPADPGRSILLLPGLLKSIVEPVHDGSKPKTELYRHDEGSYRIEWDTRKILTVPLGEFNVWKEKERYERIARLRLPFALEVQRAFAADLTRVGTPVMPPIYQSVAARLLRAHDRIFGTPEELQGDEAAFLVLTRDGQQCVLTLPLASRLKALLDERLAEMRVEVTYEGTNRKHLLDQLSALERLLDNDSAWAELLSPFKIPTASRPYRLLTGYIQVVSGKKEGDNTDSKTIAAVNLDLGENPPKQEITDETKN